jgi:hypothetical protein
VSLINGTCFKSSESSAMHFNKWSTRQMQTHKLNCSLEQSRNVNSLALFGRSMMQGKSSYRYLAFFLQTTSSFPSITFTWWTGFLFLQAERFDRVPINACLGRCSGSLIYSWCSELLNSKQLPLAIAKKENKRQIIIETDEEYAQ